MSPFPPIGAPALADAIERQYGLEVLSANRLPLGMGTINWHLRTTSGELFLKQYPPGVDVAAETAALELSRLALAGGIPGARVRPARDGRALWTDGELAVALFDWVPDATSGRALTSEQMARMGGTLGRLHRLLRPVAATFGDAADRWLAIDVAAKRARLERYLDTIARRGEPDAFDRRTSALLHRRIELLPRIAGLLASLPPLSRQVLHGDFSVWNVLFRGSELVAVVDFRPPERFLTAFEIGRAALNPETLTAGAWSQPAEAFVAAYCAAHPEIPLDDVRHAPHVWAAQLVRSEYGVREHYDAPLENQDDLDRFWFQRCAAAELILGHLDEIGARFASAWERRQG